MKTEITDAVFAQAVLGSFREVCGQKLREAVDSGKIPVQRGNSKSRARGLLKLGLGEMIMTEIVSYLRKESNKPKEGEVFFERGKPGEPVKYTEAGVKEMVEVVRRMASDYEEQIRTGRVGGLLGHGGSLFGLFRPDKNELKRIIEMIELKLGVKDAESQREIGLPMDGFDRERMG